MAISHEFYFRVLYKKLIPILFQDYERSLTGIVSK